MTEENFLDLYKYTRSDVSPNEFYKTVNKIDNDYIKERSDAFKRGVEGGKEIMLRFWGCTI